MSTHPFQIGSHNGILHVEIGQTSFYQSSDYLGETKLLFFLRDVCDLDERASGTFEDPNIFIKNVHSYRPFKNQFFITPVRMRPSDTKTINRTRRSRSFRASGTEGYKSNWKWWELPWILWGGLVIQTIHLEHHNVYQCFPFIVRRTGTK